MQDRHVIGLTPKRVGGSSVAKSVTPCEAGEAAPDPALVSLAALQVIRDELRASPAMPLAASDRLLQWVFGGPGGRGDLVGTDAAASMTDEMLAVIIEAEELEAAMVSGLADQAADCGEAVWCQPAP